MKELILNIRNLKLQISHIPDLNNFLSSLTNNNSNSSAIDLNKINWEEIKVPTAALFEIIGYLTAWKKMTELLLGWDNQLENMWFSINNVGATDADKLAINVALLPDDKNLLAELKEKLELACVVEQQGSLGVVIVNFLAAVNLALNKKPDQKANENSRVQLVIDEIQRQEKILALKEACKYYQEKLITLIEEMIKNKDHFQHLMYFKWNPALEKETIINNIIEDAEDEKIWLSSKDSYRFYQKPDLVKLLSRFRLVQQFCFVIFSPELNSEDKLSAFDLLCKNLLDIMQESHDDFGITFLDHVNHDLISKNRLKSTGSYLPVGFPSLRWFKPKEKNLIESSLSKLQLDETLSVGELTFLGNN